MEVSPDSAHSAGRYKLETVTLYVLWYKTKGVITLTVYFLWSTLYLITLLSCIFSIVHVRTAALV